MITEDRVIAAIAAALKVEAGTLRAEDGPGTVDGWDSLAGIAVVMALERLLGHRLDLGQLAMATSVGDLVRLVLASR